MEGRGEVGGKGGGEVFSDEGEKKKGRKRASWI